MKVKSLLNRFYSDCIMPSRLDEYEQIIIKALDNNYVVLSIIEYYHKLKLHQLGNQKFLIIRHDIDTDIKTAKMFFEIEKKYNIKATYYFRLATFNFDFIKELIKYGSEIGYHFEEIADYCKKEKIRSANYVRANIEEIKEVFKKNLQNFEKKAGRKVRTVASHGDFINRKLNIQNSILIDDIKLRNECGIECETYDDELFNSFDIYISDKPYPVHYYPMKVVEALGAYKVVCMLSHPRQWRANCFVNLKENLKRAYEEIIWRIL